MKMTNPNGNSIALGTKVGDKTLVSKKRVLCSGDTRWDFTWDDGSKTYDVHGQFVFYGVR